MPTATKVDKLRQSRRYGEYTYRVPPHCRRRQQQDRLFWVGLLIGMVVVTAVVIMLFLRMFLVGGVC